MHKDQAMRSPTYHYSKVTGHNSWNDGHQGQTGSQDAGLEARWAIPQVAALHEKQSRRN